MPPDPYGYPDPEGTRSDPTFVLWGGVAALILSCVGPCMCYLPNLVALPVGVWAVWAGTRQKATGPERNLVTAGMVTGGIGALLSTLLLLMILAYLIFVVVLVATGENL